MARLDLPAVGAITWDPYVFDARNLDQGFLPFMAMDLEVADLDLANPGGDGLPWEDYADHEVGAHGLVGSPDPIGRHYSNITDDFGLSNGLTLAGFVFSSVNPRLFPLDDSRLGGFEVPTPQTVPQVYIQHPYEVQAERFSGQVAGQFRLLNSNRQYHGASMTLVDLEVSDEAQGMNRGEYPGAGIKKHVVNGTSNGFVYALVPSGVVIDQAEAAYLSYSSDDLGWAVVGMDAGNIDHPLDTGNAGNEIVVGTWLDTGTRVDWQNNVVNKNRGHLLVLRPNRATGKLDVAEDLNADDLLGIDRTGIGSGVFGVKIDNVNGGSGNPGRPEIWATDATGHVYLFHYDTPQSSWKCLYRSRDLGPYPGLYNNLYPIKNSAGNTVKLIVISSGYVYCFNVDYTLVL